MSHLEDATVQIRYPSEQDLEDWLGWNPALMETLKELDSSQKDDIIESQIRLEKIDVMLTQILQMLQGLEVSNSLERKRKTICSKDSRIIKQLKMQLRMQLKSKLRNIMAFMNISQFTIF